MTLIAPGAQAEGYTISTIPETCGCTGGAGLTAIAVDNGGNLYVGGEYTVSLVSNGIVTKVAGNFLSQGFQGDGGPANDASLGSVGGLALDADGNLYIADGYHKHGRRGLEFGEC